MSEEERPVVQVSLEVARFAVQMEGRLGVIMPPDPFRAFRVSYLLQQLEDQRQCLAKALVDREHAWVIRLHAVDLAVFALALAERYALREGPADEPGATKATD